MVVLSKKTGRTKANKSLEEEKTRLIGKNMTLEQAKQEVLALVDKGTNYREISKIPFTVNNAIRRFSISKISEWVKERDRHVKEDEGSLAAKAFELFVRGKEPIKAVIELKQPPELVQELYDKWIEMNDALLIRREDKEEIFDKINFSTSYRAYTIDELKKAIENLVSDHEKLKEFTYPCNVCGKILYADPDNEWKWIIEEGYMSMWGHASCHEKKET